MLHLYALALTTLDPCFYTLLGQVLGVHAAFDTMYVIQTLHAGL